MTVSAERVAPGCSGKHPLNRLMSFQLMEGVTRLSVQML